MDFEMSQAGMFVPHEYKEFKNRIVFPICDEQGRMVGMSGRRIGDPVNKENNCAPKYINTKGSGLFKKREILYGHLAADSIYKLLCSFKEVTIITASVMICVTNNFKNFAFYRHLSVNLHSQIYYAE